MSSSSSSSSVQSQSALSSPVYSARHTSTPLSSVSPVICTPGLSSSSSSSGFSITANNAVGSPFSSIESPSHLDKVTLSSPFPPVSELSRLDDEHLVWFLSALDDDGCTEFMSQTSPEAVKLVSRALTLTKDRMRDTHASDDAFQQRLIDMSKSEFEAELKRFSVFEMGLLVSIYSTSNVIRKRIYDMVGPDIAEMPAVAEQKKKDEIEPIPSIDVIYAMNDAALGDFLKGVDNSKSVELMNVCTGRPSLLGRICESCMIRILGEYKTSDELAISWLSMTDTDLVVAFSGLKEFELGILFRYVLKPYKAPLQKRVFALIENRRAV